MKRNWSFSFEKASLPVKILVVLGGILAGIGFAALFGFIVMWLWNWLMPAIFGLPVIDFWKAWGLVLLSELLLKRSSHETAGSGMKMRRKRALRERMSEVRDPCDERESEGGHVDEAT